MNTENLSYDKSEERLPWYASSHNDVLEYLQTSASGLNEEEVERRLLQYGYNILPTAKRPGLVRIFFRQFVNPLIYILLFATVLSLALNHITDAVFILAVLLCNAIIGTVQESNAEKSAEALRNLVKSWAMVIRQGNTLKLDAAQLVPGDIVVLESGNKVPADIRLFASHSLEVDESLLTGESLAVTKNASAVLPESVPLAEQINMIHAGTVVSRGRGKGVVVATGPQTQIGKIASSLVSAGVVKPPLLLRMERFTKRIALGILCFVGVMGGISLIQGNTFAEVALFSIALAVSAIPEGLPVAITVALSIASHRMSKRNVIVRKLVAVEALGSCTFVATDKTGTLTLNHLTAKKIALPKEKAWDVTGEGLVPQGELLVDENMDKDQAQTLTKSLSYAAILSNEGSLIQKRGHWTALGDAVDVALLVMGQKMGISRETAAMDFPQLAHIPFESERQFSASLHQQQGFPKVYAKGAPEKIMRMCSQMLTRDGLQPLDHHSLEEQAKTLAAEGFRVIALASGELEQSEISEKLEASHLRGLTFLGYVGLIDPLRPGVKEAIATCKKGGIQVCMVTGDHPITALAIARELGIAKTLDQVVTGPMLQQATAAGEEQLAALVENSFVFARVEPKQKLEIVQALSKKGHFVAVTGDGANDAPALTVGHVGVAMGERGTDVAKEAADLIITDDNFSSIVAGMEEGRVAYANIRKVIYLLLSTGIAEIILILLSTIAGLPLPLTAVQLLWLNLVTNGIQDIALAFEPAEGEEMEKPPRSPQEPIFNRLMIERCLLSGLVVSGVSFWIFWGLMSQGTEITDARNTVLLLMVLFENIQVGNSRSELKSGLFHNPLRNPLLLYGTIAAQLIHIAAMYTPGISLVLEAKPVSLAHWVHLLLWASSVFVVMEIYKWIRRS